MDRQPVEDIDWILDPNGGEAPLAPMAGDPYFPNEPEEEEPEEDPEEPDYEPADVPDFLDEDSEDEEIPLDDAQPIECLSEEEVSLPPSPRAIPYYQPYQREGKGPWLRTTPGTDAQPDLYSFADRPISGCGKVGVYRTLPDPTCGSKRKVPEGPAHYEIGESSQTRPPPPPHAACACQAQLESLTHRTESLEDHVRSIHGTSRTTRQRVDALEEEERQDTEAISTLYHRDHASRTDIISLQARADHHEERGSVTHSQLAAASRAIAELRAENSRLREQFDEMVRYMRARFGR